MNAAVAQASARQQWQQMLEPAPAVLPGRHVFHARLEQALADRRGSGPTLAVLSMELVGIGPGDERALDDEAMRIVVARLMMALHVQDTACRIGDEAFACLLVDAVDRDRLGERAGRLADAMTAPLQLDAKELRLQPSIGIAMYPFDGATGARLFRRADAARRRAGTRRQAWAFFDRQVDV